MESIIEFLYQFKEFLNPKVMIDTLLGWLGGYVYFGLFFIIFAETGLAVGFFSAGRFAAGRRRTVCGGRKNLISGSC